MFSKKNKAEIVLPIQGMHCPMCTGRMQKAFLENKGVLEVTVSLENQSATILYNADKVSPAQLREIVTNTGYTVPEE